MDVKTPDSVGSEWRAVRYGPGERVTPPTLPGDFILTHSKGFFAALIRFGQALRYRGRNAVFAHWSHTAVFVNESGDIIEALDCGVQQDNISRYVNTEYVVVYLPEAATSAERENAVKFAVYCLNDSYGWLTVCSIALCLVTGGKFGFGVDGQQICSGLVARCLERVGSIFREGEPWRLMPADLAHHFDVRAAGERGTVPDHDAGVVHASRPGRRPF